MATPLGALRGHVSKDEPRPPWPAGGLRGRVICFEPLDRARSWAVARRVLAVQHRGTGPVEDVPPGERLADSSGAAARLRLSATRLARRLRQQADAGLTPSQLSALAVIEFHGSLTLKSLAEHERLAPPSITRVVNKLEADGLVVRTNDLGDRRITRVATSAQGAALMVESRRRKTAWLAGQIARLDPDQQRRLAAALDVLDVLATEDRS